MANKNFLDKAEGLVSNPKRLIALIVVIALIAIAVYFSWNKIKQLFAGITHKIQTDQDIVKEIGNGNPPSYTDAKYKDLANQLYTAMKGVGTDTATVKRVFEEMNNITDVLKLVSAFGTRDGENLSQLIAVETWLYKNTRNTVNKILTAKGIFYKF
jgi:hypothetical protein